MINTMTKTDQPKTTCVYNPNEELLARIDPSFLGAIARWVHKGIPPGGFLTACLSNDLSGAVCRADDRSIGQIRDIVILSFNYLPIRCYGSADAVRRWSTERNEYTAEFLDTHYGWLKNWIAR
jgi:hypothetical protein